MNFSKNRQATLLGVNVRPVGLEDAFLEVIEHIPKKRGAFFCLANIHLVMECRKDPGLVRILNSSAGNFADGMGLVMGLKMLGCKFKFKVRGTDLMLKLCHYASQHSLKIFLYGNTAGTLRRVIERITALYPRIEVAGAIAPPFRKMTEAEDFDVIRKMNDLDPDILFLSLGAPKQERWMAEHSGRIRPIQLGVGAAFDFIAGVLDQAPLWMQKTPLEWLHRLPQQPTKTIHRMAMVPGFFFLTFLQILRDGRNQVR